MFSDNTQNSALRHTTVWVWGVSQSSCRRLYALGNVFLQGVGPTGNYAFGGCALEGDPGIDSLSHSLSDAHDDQSHGVSQPRMGTETWSQLIVNGD